MAGNRTSAGRRRLPWPVWALAAGCTGVYLAASLTLCRLYLAGMDLALYGEAVRGYAHGGLPWSHIKAQVPFDLLGDHFTPIMALLGPVYRLWPDVRVLLIAQAVLFGVAVLGVGAMASARLRPRQALLVQACFGLSWGVLNATVFAFHEIAFAVPLLVWAVWAVWETPRWGQYALACVLLVATKEDSTLMTAGLGLMLIARGRVRAGLITGAASVAVFVALIGWVIPSLNAQGTYTYLAGKGVGASLSILAGPDFWLFLLTLAVTLGLGWRSPLAWALLPAVAARLVGGQAQAFRFGYHYNATLMVICFLAVVDAWSRAPLTPRWRTRTDLAQAVALVLVAAMGVVSSVVAVDLRMPSSITGRAQALDRAVAMVPDGAPVIADEFVLAHLVDDHPVSIANIAWTDSLGAPLARSGWIILDTASYSWDDIDTGWESRQAASLEGEGCAVMLEESSILVLEC
ncbi:MAG: DUF2079 domain-containing protein [Propionibacteriaceae bacterium]|nr:DUF2079 domain-containing protein [Propionibacteriaceae bacterium]